MYWKYVIMLYQYAIYVLKMFIWQPIVSGLCDRTNAFLNFKPIGAAAEFQNTGGVQ